MACNGKLCSNHNQHNFIALRCFIGGFSLRILLAFYNVEKKNDDYSKHNCLLMIEIANIVVLCSDLRGVALIKLWMSYTLELFD